MLCSHALFDRGLLHRGGCSHGVQSGVAPVLLLGYEEQQLQQQQQQMLVCDRRVIVALVMVGHFGHA